MMILYSGTACPFSQRCRIVLFEKGMDFEIKDIDPAEKADEIAAMNPYSHPHGGGEGRTGAGRPPVSPWGKLAKGGKTRKRKNASNRLILRKRTK